MSANSSDSPPESPRKFKIYTRTGDKGTSSLYTGERRSKTDIVFEALGAVDELNSHVGVAREHCTLVGNGLDTELATIQSRLLDVGSHIATPRSSQKETKIAKTEFSAEQVKLLEDWIDAHDEQLPPLTSFILPSGGLSSASLHVCRSVCRRAERQVVPLVESGEVDPVVGQYLNRLSDYFFNAARHAAQHDGRTEVVYKKA